MLLSIIYIIAITAEAMTGALAAGRRQMDLFGVIIIACVTALGGGTIRDVVLGHYPLSWVENPKYLAYTVTAALLTILLAPIMHYLRKPFLVLDALGLVAFTLIGCAIALEMNQSVSITVISGMITGVFGGVLRDVLCNEIPLVFRKELYAIVSLLTGIAYVSLLTLNVHADTAIVSCLIGGFLLRLCAIHFGWEMPKFVYRDPNTPDER
jgi:uncharacterized membrane protein YeiH